MAVVLLKQQLHPEAHYGRGAAADPHAVAGHRGAPVVLLLVPGAGHSGGQHLYHFTTCYCLDVTVSHAQFVRRNLLRSL